MNVPGPGRTARAVLLATGIVAGCVRTAPVRYYTLPDLADGPTEGRTAPPRYTVRLSALSVPEALDRPELLLRLSPTEVGIDDGHRWMEPLRTAIGRAVTGHLARALAAARVEFAEDATARDGADVNVTFALRRLELEPGRQATLEADWDVRWTDGHARSGRSITRAAASGPDRDALVAAAAQALAIASGDIARAIGL